MKSRIVGFILYNSPYRPEETLVRWDKLVVHQGEGHSLGLEKNLRSLKA